MEVSEWFSTKEKLPPENVLVLAMNPYITSLSWIDGTDELGKRSWCHEEWNHADQFVTQWRYLSDEEVVFNSKLAEDGRPTWFRYGCQIKYRKDIDE